MIRPHTFILLFFTIQEIYAQQIQAVKFGLLELRRTNQHLKGKQLFKEDLIFVQIDSNFD